MRYPALIDGESGAYGIVFPDLPGIVAMGTTIEEVICRGEEALQDYVLEAVKDGTDLVCPTALEDVEVPPGNVLTSILLVHVEPEKPSVRLNLVLDAGIAQAIDSEARRRGITRKTYVEWMVRTVAQVGG